MPLQGWHAQEVEWFPKIYINILHYMLHIWKPPQCVVWRLVPREKTKLMMDNTSSISTKIKANGHRFETVIIFKSLDCVITNKASKPESEILDT